MGLSTAEYRRLFAFIRDLHASEAFEDLWPLLGDSVAPMIDAESFAIHEYASDWSDLLIWESPQFPYNVAEKARYYELADQHPLLLRYLQSGAEEATAIGDTIGMARWREHPIYRECMRNHGDFDTLGIMCSTPMGSMTGISMDRERLAFTRDDCERLELVAPHVAMVVQRLRLQTENPLREDESFQIAQLRQDLKLTQREAAVLYWIGEGKSNAEIALILNIKVPTVKRHAANIYAKLGLENRYAATVLVWSTKSH